MLSGPGGNVVVLHGPDGKIVVDSFVQPAWPKLKAAIDALDGPSVKTLIDTHWHLDHTDNNANFRAAGAAVRRAREHEEADGRAPRAARHALQSVAGGGASDRRPSPRSTRCAPTAKRSALTYVPPAHTDTDIFVHYAKGNVLHMGDTFFNGMYPFIDAGTGGKINGMIGAAERALKMTNATTKIVPGHGPLADRAVLEAYRTMLTTVRDRVRTQKGAGRTLAEVQAAKPSAEFDAVWGKGMMPPDNFVALVYDTL